MRSPLMTHRTLRRFTSLVGLLTLLGSAAFATAGCSSSPEEGKAEPIPIDQNLVCSAVNHGGGDGCGGGGVTGSSSGGTVACGNEGEPCCNGVCDYANDVCDGNYTCSAETFSQATGPKGDTKALDYGRCLIDETIGVPCALSTMHCSQGVLYQDKSSDPPMAAWACAEFTSTPGYAPVGPYESACLGQPDPGLTVVEYLLEEIPLMTCDGITLANMPGTGPCHPPLPP